MNTPKILSTTDYKIFKKIDSNRDINKLHLRKLIGSITTKNMLYLFPLVVNSQMEVVDGQHRLQSAIHLQVPVYYLIDDTITKADIALMNSNRRGWAVRDYIDFYAKEGNVDFKRVQVLLDAHKKLTTMCAVRLLDKDAVRYTDGGGKYSRNIKSGSITTAQYALSEIICDLCEKMLKDRHYAFDGFFVMDIKNVIIQSGQAMQKAADTIYKKRLVLPVIIEGGYVSLLTELKDMLGIKSFRPGSTKEEVDSFLEKNNIDKSKFTLNG